MIPDQLIAAMLLGAGLLIALPALMALLGPDREEDEESRIRAAARREELRQEMDRHPVERLDWRSYRRRQNERLRRPYSGTGQ